MPTARTLTTAERELVRHAETVANERNFEFGEIHVTIKEGKALDFVCNSRERINKEPKQQSTGIR